MANRRYISPIRFFEHADLFDDNKQLAPPSRVKKIIQAEFSLSESGTVELDEKDYNKSDLLEEVDSPDFEQRLTHHQFIWKNNYILELLEDDVLNLDHIHSQLTPSLLEQPHFVQFFSFYFAEPFNNLYKHLLKMNEIDLLAGLVALNKFIEPADEDIAYSALRQHLQEIELLFHNINKQNVHAFQKELQPWVNTDWHKYFNALPSQFDHEKNDMVRDIINASVAMENFNREHSLYLTAQLNRVKNVDPELRRIIINNYDVYRKSGKSSGGFNYWWLVWLAFMLLKVIGAGGC